MSSSCITKYTTSMMSLVSQLPWLAWPLGMVILTNALQPIEGTWYHIHISQEDTIRDELSVSNSAFFSYYETLLIQCNPSYFLSLVSLSLLIPFLCRLRWSYCLLSSFNILVPFPQSPCPFFPHPPAPYKMDTCNVWGVSFHRDHSMGQSLPISPPP